MGCPPGVVKSALTDRSDESIMNNVHNATERLGVTTRWGDRETRRREIVLAGRRLLEQDGLTALQMREVAKAAGISLGTVYTYFPNKEALFGELYAERLDELLAVIEPLCIECEDPEELLVGVATAYLDVYRVFGRELDLWSILAGESLLDPAVTGKLLAAASRVLATAHATTLRIVQSRTPAADIDTNLAVTLLWSCITGLADQFTGVRQHMHPYSWDQAIRFAAHTLIAGLTALAVPPLSLTSVDKES